MYNNLTTHPEELKEFFPNSLIKFFKNLEDSFDLATVYFVGGSVRDAVLRRIPHDFDIEIFGILPELLTNYLEDNCTSVKLAGNGFPVWMIVVDGYEVQIALPRRERVKTVSYTDFEVTIDPYMSLKEAASRRDFTMNSLYMSTNFQIVDNFNGLRDLYLGILRPTSEKFMEDPLRVKRAMRFLSQFNLIASQELIQYSINLLPYARNLEKDVIAREWEKWSKTDYPQNGIQFLRECGWIKLYPYLQELTTTPQSPIHHPEGDAFAHTLLVLSKVHRFCSEQNRSVLTFAALMHDFGKVVSTIVESDGKITSLGHESFSAEFSIKFFESIHPTYFKRIEMQVYELCELHMKFHNLDEISKRNIRRTIAKLQYNSFNTLMELIICDILGRDLDLTSEKIALDLCLYLANTYKEVKESDLLDNQNKIVRIIDGNFLISKGLKPGKIFGIILADALDAQIEEVLDDSNKHSWFDAYIKNIQI